MMCALVLVDACVVVAEILLELNAMRNRYREATSDLLFAVSLLRQIYATTSGDVFKQNHDYVDHGVKYHHDNDGQLGEDEFYIIDDVAFEQHARTDDDVTMVSRDNTSSALNTVAVLIESVASIGEQLANRMHIAMDERTTVNIGTFHTTETGARENFGGRQDLQHDVTTGLLRHSHAEQMFQAAHFFHLCSIGILGIFVIQVIIKIQGMGRLFFKKKMELFDAVIIIASFALDLVFVDGITGVQGEEALALIIIFLLWRVLRVINGLMVTAERRQEFRVKLQKRARRRTEKRIEYLEDEKNWKEREVVNLRQLCWEKGASEDQIAICKPMRRSVYQKMDTSTGLSSIASLSLVVSMSMSGTGSRAMLARSAAGLIPALLTPRHRRSSGSSSFRSSPGAAHYERRPPSVTPPSRHHPEPVVPQAADTTTNSIHRPTTQCIAAPKCSPMICQPEVEIVVHRISDCASVRFISDTTHAVLTKSRSDNTLQATATLVDGLVAVGNGFIHTT